MKEVLDHGYVKLVEAWGSDSTIIEAARMSTQKGFNRWGPACSKCGIGVVVNDDGEISPSNYEKGEQKECAHDANVKGDEHLLEFLYRNKHMTPFEMCGATFEVQAPIFVIREWHRHRTQSYSEMSARYAPLPDVNYIPSIERLMRPPDNANKQAGTVKGAEMMTEGKAIMFREALSEAYEKAEALYQNALTMGVPKEVARVILPVGRYTRMRASANLRNWLQFLTLRLDPAAQWEIRQFADAVADGIERRFPRTWALWISTNKK